MPSAGARPNNSARRGKRPQRTVGLSCGAFADGATSAERGPPAVTAAVAALRESTNRDGYVQVEPAARTVWVGAGRRDAA